MSSTKTPGAARPHPHTQISWGALQVILAPSQDDPVLFHARRMRERQVRLGNDTWGVSTMPPRPVISLHDTSKREMEEVKRIFNTNEALSAPAYKFRRIGARGFDFLSTEGLASVLPIIKEYRRGAVCFSATIEAGALSAATVDAFNRVRKASRTSECCVVIFLRGADKQATDQLLNYADDLGHLHRCEPEPHAQLGFCVKWTGFLYCADLGENLPKMISVYALNGEFRDEVTDFLAGELSTRVMARLRDGGRTLEDIGAAFSLNKSTVKRRLDPVRRGTFRDEDEGWLSNYEQYLDIDTVHHWRKT